MASRPLTLTLSVIASASVGPCKPHATSLVARSPTVSLSTAICDIQGTVAIDMNTGNPPTFLQRAYTGTESECLSLCRAQDQCVFVGYSEQNTQCLMLAGTPAESYFEETTFSSIFWYERSCLGE